jgi:hypothetical protein
MLDDAGSVVSRHSFTPSEYANILQGLPVMDEKTQEILIRAYSVANPRKMGYADPRPDVRPKPLMRIGPEQEASRNQFGGSGLAGRADAVWAGGLRPGLYSPAANPKAAAKTGEELKHTWSGGGVAPSDVVPGYAYRHAAATSQFAHAGNVYDRLTDVRGFTGVHRHRFDADGRGMGLAGRDTEQYDYKGVVEALPLEHGQGMPWLPGKGPNEPGPRMK